MQALHIAEIQDINNYNHPYFSQSMNQNALNFNNTTMAQYSYPNHQVPENISYEHHNWNHSCNSNELNSYKSYKNYSNLDQEPVNQNDTWENEFMPENGYKNDTQLETFNKREPKNSNFTHEQFCSENCDFQQQ